ncbi:MAG: hypothetical protein HKL85_07070 [Acidimicrobiaceae bacterium]|nr:hypothetical protein [Acidimicrobiaceae bacterium]
MLGSVGDGRYGGGLANEVRTARPIARTPPNGDVGVGWRPSRVDTG